jgi:hypothetical protein
VCSLESTYALRGYYDFGDAHIFAMNPLPGMSPVHSFASWPILRGGGCTFSQTRHGRNTAKAKSTQPTSTLTEIPPTYTQVFAHCPLKARNQRGRRRQPGEFVNLVRYLSMPHSMHKVPFRNHRSGRRAYFRLSGQLSQVCAAKACNFSHIAYYPPVCANRGPVVA